MKATGERWERVIVAGGATRASGCGRQMRKAFKSRRSCRAPQTGHELARRQWRSQGQAQCAPWSAENEPVSTGDAFAGYHKRQGGRPPRSHPEK